MRIGSRGSSLARAQAEHVAGLLGGAEVRIISTSGDRPGGAERAGAEAAARQDGDATRPNGGLAHAEGDKSRWVDTIERALLSGEIDLAVHSAKDVPGELAPGLSLLGCPARAPVQDALCGAGGLGELPQGARVGTSSLRRAAQLRAARADLEVVAVHGNVDTRLRKLEHSALDSALDAIVLARAGLLRLEREREIGALLDPEIFVPAPGQGTLALEGRTGDKDAWQAAQAITDEQAFACLTAERALAGTLEASCNTPFGAWCHPGGGGKLRLRAWVGLPDGSAWIADELQGPQEDPDGLAALIAERMRAVGAGELLAAAEAVAQ